MLVVNGAQTRANFNTQIVVHKQEKNQNKK